MTTADKVLAANALLALARICERQLSKRVRRGRSTDEIKQKVEDNIAQLKRLATLVQV